MSTAVSAAPVAAATKPRRARLTAAKRRQYGAAYALVLPFFIVFVAMVIVPLVYAGYLSLYRKRLIGGTSFAGAENYIRARTDPLFLGGVGRMAIFLIIQVPFMIALSLFFALALDSGMMKLAKFSRLAIFVPYAVPGVVATSMWGYLYGPDFGPFAQIGKAVGFGPPPFLTQTGMLFSIMKWNNYFLPLIMLNSQDKFPLTVGLALWQSTAAAGGGSQALFSVVITGSLLSIIPLVVAFLFLQRYWQSGLASGGVKA